MRKIKTMLSFSMIAFVAASSLPAISYPVYADESSLPEEYGIYCITSAQNKNEVLDVQAGQKNAGANIQAYASNDTGAQRFAAQPNDDGTWTFMNMASGKVLDVSGGSHDEGANVQQWTSNDTDAQKWNLQDNGDGTVTFLNAGSGLALDIEGDTVSNGSNAAVFSPDDSETQKFMLQLKSDTDLINNGVYKISSTLNASKVLDVAGGSAANGANVQLYSSNGSNAQLFTAKHNADDTWSFINKGSGKVVDVCGGCKDAGTNVWQYASNGTAAQKWNLKDNGDGSLTLISASSGRVIDVSAGNTTDGTNIQIWNSNGTAAQKFTFTYQTDAVLRRVNKTTSFLEHVRAVWQTAYDNNWVYGNSRSEVPCADGIISCDRMIARALWDMGYTDQQTGGITIYTMDDYLTSHGFLKITDKNQLQAGDIILLGHEDGTPVHTVVITSFNGISEACGRYDCGCIELIRGPQPVYSILEYKDSVIAAYRIT